MQTPEQIFVAINPGTWADVQRRLKEQDERIQRLEKAIAEQDAFGHLPPWVTLQDAKRITGYSDGRTIAKWVDRGVIRIKSVSDRGKRYCKEDCLHFAARAQQWKIEND